jgi:hypothetical protein
MKEQFDEVLKSQAEELASMRSITTEVYAALQVDEQEFLKALQDESRYTPDEWTSLQKHRAMLEKGLNKRLQETSKKTTAKEKTLVQPHWIFVR